MDLFSIYHGPEFCSIFCFCIIQIWIHLFVFIYVSHNIICVYLCVNNIEEPVEVG